MLLCSLLPNSMRERQLGFSQYGKTCYPLWHCWNYVSGCLRSQAIYTWGAFSMHPLSGVGSSFGVLGLWGHLYLHPRGHPSSWPWVSGGSPWWHRCLRRFLSFCTTLSLAGELCQGWQPLNASLIFKSIQVISIWILCILSNRTKCKYIQIHPYEEINRGSSA